MALLTKKDRLEWCAATFLCLETVISYLYIHAQLSKCLKTRLGVVYFFRKQVSDVYCVVIKSASLAWFCISKILYKLYNNFAKSLWLACSSAGEIAGSAWQCQNLNSRY